MTILDADSPKPDGDGEEGDFAVPTFDSPPAPKEPTGRQIAFGRVKALYQDTTPAMRWSVVGGAVVITLILSIWLTFVRTHQVSATVEGKTWKREIEVQKFQTVREEDWDYPSDARNIDSFRAIHHYERVIAYYNIVSRQCGTTERPQTCYDSEPVYREDPVYRTKYRYDVDRWRTERWLTTTGNYDTPTWAEIPTTFADISILGHERQGGETHESYVVHVVCGNHDDCDDTLNISMDLFVSIAQGQRVTASVTATGNVRSINLPSRS